MPPGEFDDSAGYGEGPGRDVEVTDTQFGEFPPTQPCLDVGLDEQAHGVVLESSVEPVELFGGQDPAGLPRDGWGLDAAARVQGDDLVVHGGGEDGVEDDLAASDGRRVDLVDFLKAQDEAPNVSREQGGQFHVAQLGQDVSVQQVRVRLSGRGFDDVAGEPLGLDIVAHGLLAAARVA